jgi:DedD protein
MDRRLKERLVGAAILVILAVLLIPEFLSGPAQQRAGPVDEPAAATVTGAAGTIRTYRVDLDQPASGGMVATDANPAPVREAQPAPAAPGAAVESVSGKAATSSEAPHRIEASAVARHPAALHGGWVLQLGSFASKPTAERLARTLRAKGIQIQVSSSKTRHRVRAGPFADRAAAEHVAAELRAQGQASTIVPP